MTNAEHLARLEGAAFAVATDYLQTFPGAVLLSSARDVQGQAVAMARNCFRQRTWILGDPHAEPPIKATYRWGRAAMLCHDWSVTHPTAPLVDIASAFTGILSALPREELEKLSRHLVPPGAKARAFDTQPFDDEREPAQVAWLTEQARVRGGVFLTQEGELKVFHWQAAAIETVGALVCA